MIYSVPPPSPAPDDRDPSDNWPSQAPDTGHGAGDRGYGGRSWVHGTRPGRVSSHVPVHLVEAVLIGCGADEPAEGLVRFRIPDADEAGRSRRARRRPAALGRQLAGTGGELRLIRGGPSDRTGMRRAPVAVLTLNGITDIVTLVRLDVGTPFPSIAGKEVGRVATVGVEVRFSAGLWDLAVPEHTRCQVHLEGVVRLRRAWPMP